MLRLVLAENGSCTSLVTPDQAVSATVSTCLAPLAQCQRRNNRPRKSGPEIGAREIKCAKANAVLPIQRSGNTAFSSLNKTSRSYAKPVTGDWGDSGTETAALEGRLPQCHPEGPRMKTCSRCDCDLTEVSPSSC